MLPLAHPLLGRAVTTPHKSVIFETLLNHPQLAFLFDHQVNGRAVFPGAGYLETTSAALRCLQEAPLRHSLTAVLHVVISSPLILDTAPGVKSENQPTQPSQTTLRCTVALRSGTCELASLTPPHGGVVGTEGKAPAVHMRSTSVNVPSSLALPQKGHFGQGPSPAQAQGESSEGSMTSLSSLIDRTRAACSTPLATGYLYQGLAEAGLQYGPAFRLLESIKQGAAAASGVVKAPQSGSSGDYRIHPAALDNCLQLGAAVPGSKSSQTRVPSAIQAFLVAKEMGRGDALASAMSSPGKATGPSLFCDHALFDWQGRAVCIVDSLESKPIGAALTSTQPKSSSKPGPTSDILYELTWLASESRPDSQPDSQHGSQHGSQYGSKPAELLAPASRGLFLHPKSSSAAALSGLIPLQSAAGDPSAPLRLLTRGQHQTSPLPTRSDGSLTAGVWAMTRCLRQEHPSASCYGSDLDPLSPTPLAPLGKLGLGSHGDAVIQLSEAPVDAAFDGYGMASRAGTLHVARLLPSAVSSMATPFQLLPMPRGHLDGLVPQAMVMGSIPAGQVLLEVSFLYFFGETAFFTILFPCRFVVKMVAYGSYDSLWFH